MSLRGSFARLPFFIRGACALVLAFFVMLAIGIAIDAWLIQRSEFVPGARVVHVRHYVLPVGGFVLMLFLWFRFALPPAHTALRTLAYGGGIRRAFPDFLRGLVWSIAALSACAIAWAVQTDLFGFFLPP